MCCPDHMTEKEKRKLFWQVGALVVWTVGLPIIVTIAFYGSTQEEMRQLKQRVQQLEERARDVRD